MSKARSKLRKSPFARTLRIVYVVALAAIVGYVIVLYVMDWLDTRERFNQAVADLETAVFIAPILEDQSEARSAFWDAIRDAPAGKDEVEVRQDLFNEARQISRRYRSAALRGADDVNILGVWLSRTETILWLSERNPDACADFVIEGALRPDVLGKDFAETYARHIEALKTAYLEGHGKEPRAVLENETFATLLLGYFGFSEAEVEVLQDPATKSAMQICAAGLTVATGLDLVPEHQQIPFVRQFLTVDDLTDLLR